MSNTKLLTRLANFYSTIKDHGPHIADQLKRAFDRDIDNYLRRSELSDDDGNSIQRYRPPLTNNSSKYVEKLFDNNGLLDIHVQKMLDTILPE